MTPTHPGDRAGSRVQLAQEVQLDGRLAEFEHLTEARRLERLAESEIIRTLQLQNFDPGCDEWTELARALAEYGYAVIVGWGITGSLYRMAAQHGGGRGVYGLGKVPENLQLGEDDARALAAELLMVAIEAFRSRTLMDKTRAWSPAGGASLKTYFVGRCLMELPDVYAEWHRREHRPLGDHNRHVLKDDGRHLAGPAETVGSVTEVDDLFGDDSTTRLMFQLQDAGFSLGEIADMLTSAGIASTEGSVRTRMSRFRVAARRRNDG